MLIDARSRQRAMQSSMRDALIKARTKKFLFAVQEMYLQVFRK